MLGLGLTKTYELIGTGELKSFTIGARRLIAAEALDDFMARKMAEGESSPDAEQRRLMAALAHKLGPPRPVPTIA